MADSEQHYSQSEGDDERVSRRGRGGDRRQYSQPPEDEYGYEEAPRRGSGRRGRVSASQLPPNRLGTALIAGLIAGVLCSLQAIAITILNAGTYQRAAQATTADAGLLAGLVVGLACLTFFISMFICFLAGLLTGRFAVERRLGFLAGFLGGALYYALAFFLVRYIPGYPGNQQATANPGISGLGIGLLVSLVFLLILGALGGLAGLLGAWFATRRHPYYAR